MYSGSDSTESANYGQWPLNPAFFQNMPNEQVDWAALAQQWIQMKEAGPPIPEPKPPNNISEVKEIPQVQKKILPPINSEDNVANSSWNSAPNSVEPYDSSWNWKAQPNWEWGNPAWNPPPNTPQVVNPSPKTTLLPLPKGYTSVEAPKDNPSVSVGYTSVKSNDFGSSYSGQSASNHSRNYKAHNRRYSKVNIPKASTPSPVNIPLVPESESNNLDANKRKQLPAWIREGLEKMEKDKLKQMEKEKEKEKSTSVDDKLKEIEKEAMDMLRDTISERRRSKFDSDEEQSPKQLEEKEEPEPLNHDELIILVRRTMTEILLKVTNESIHSICTDERQRYIKKTQTLGKVTGKTNVEAKLGLGMYGSDSGSESDNSDSSRKDSDDELKNSIRRRKADFVHTEKGIEDKLQQAEKEKDNKRTKDEDEGSSENHIEEYTPEPKKEEGNSKSKDTNSKHRQSSSPSSNVSDDESSHRRSSSSRESSISRKRGHRDRSGMRGYTPEKRRKHKTKRSRSRSYERRHSSDYKYKKDRNRSDRSRRSPSRTSRSSRRSRSRSSSYRSRRSSDRSSRSKRKRSRSPFYSRSSKRSRSRSYIRSSRR